MNTVLLICAIISATFAGAFFYRAYLEMQAQKEKKGFLMLAVGGLLIFFLPGIFFLLLVGAIILMMMHVL